MKTTLRPFAGADDLGAMLALASSSRDETLHVVDLPYRLSSWALDDPANVALWTDGLGSLVAWAALQAPFWAVDFALRPGADSLFPQVLDWAWVRACSVRGTPHERSSWYVNVFGDQVDRQRRLEAAGFACQADVGENSWSRVLMRREASLPPASLLATEFTVRPLAGPADVDAYVELHRATFESKNMTVEWRTRTLRAPHHLSDTDLIVVTDDGQVAGFCIGWLLPGAHALGQVEPFGIGREFRERGLGAGLLAEVVRRLLVRGARAILVETDTYRTPALGLYEGAGFSPLRDILVYRRDAEIA